MERSPMGRSPMGRSPNGEKRELPKYKCHKEVRAIKISDVTRDPSGVSVTITPAEAGYGPFQIDSDWMRRFNDDEDDMGYFVVYKDGYASWSPSKAFEEGYTLIGDET